jgi:TM2 domain-containing membrane protein YozV
MNCATHPETPAAAYCRTCGKALCMDCRRQWQGVIFCDGCVGAQQAAPLPRPVDPDAPSPGLAFFLGLIPGVGAIYNGQYGKGILHVVILGLLISIVNSNAAGDLEVLFGLMIPAWILYMALEAYHTAKRRLAGLPVDEFSSLFPAGPQPGRVPLGPLALILLGTVFLLHTLGALELRSVLRFWPVLLIAAGAYWLYVRTLGRAAPSPEGASGSQEPPPDSQA